MSFRGASAEAFAALTSALEGALAQGADASQVGSDLFSVAGVLRREPALRRVATDVSVDATAKAGLVTQLFAGKVSETVASLLSSAVSHRWTAPSDFTHALEELAVVATVKSAGADSARLSEELFVLGGVLQGSPELRSALSDPARSVDDKRALLTGLLANKALPATLALAERAMDGTHRTVDAAVAEYQRLAAQVHGRKVATVTVAAPLNDADQSRLAAALQRKYDAELELNVVVDPNVLGGVKVEIGDEVIDGTVASTLDDARRKLAV